MTHMQILTDALTRIGIPFELTDDSEESPGIDDPAETVVLVHGSHEGGGRVGRAYFFFTRDGSYKEMDAF